MVAKRRPIPDDRGMRRRAREVSGVPQRRVVLGRQRLVLGRHQAVLGRLLIGIAALVATGCGFGAPAPSASPSAAPQTQASAATARPALTPAAATEQPSAEPTEGPRTFAIQVERPNRGISAEPGEVIFGTGYEEGRNIKVTDERSRFGTDADVAWRVTLPAAEGGEQVSVVLVSTDGETIIDEFTADEGWNVYFGTLTAPLDPGAYRLRYFIDGEQAAGGRFTVRQR